MSGKPRHALTARLERAAFAALFLAAVALAAYLSQRHAVSYDWTAAARNTLSAPSRDLLARMPEPIRVVAFASGDDRLREAIRQLVGRYRRERADLALDFVDPQLDPREAGRLGIETDGELVVEYQGRREHVSRLTERDLTNALARLAGGAARWIAYLTGHGERDLLGGSRRDLGEFGRHLETLGYLLRPLSLAEDAGVPDNVSVLVVLEPTAPPLPVEHERIAGYVARGGNVLWLADAGGTAYRPLARALGVHPEPGMLVDPASRLDGRATPEFVVVSGYADHPVTSGLDGFTAFPTATSLGWEAPPGWRARGIASTGLRAWRETGDLAAAVRFDDGEDAAGPLDVAVALERPRPAGGGTQRVLVVGDADFLSNAYLGLGANRALGGNALGWLAGDEVLIDIAPVMAPDLGIAPSRAAQAVIALGPPVALPLAVLAYGLLRWRRRRGR